MTMQATHADLLRFISSAREMPFEEDPSVLVVAFGEEEEAMYVFRTEAPDGTPTYSTTLHRDEYRADSVDEMGLQLFAFALGEEWIQGPLQVAVTEAEDRFFEQAKQGEGLEWNLEEIPGKLILRTMSKRGCGYFSVWLTAEGRVLAVLESDAYIGIDVTDPAS